LKLTALFRHSTIALLVASATSFADMQTSKHVVFDDATIHVELPDGWSIEGEAGEYMLESDDQEDIGSMLIIPFDSDTTLEERLAEIDEQFLATGIIELEEAEERQVDGETISYRRYRLMMADVEGADVNSTLLHQYVFWRSEVHALLQVESNPGKKTSEELFSKVFETLEIHETPLPFRVDDPWAEEED
jgi:hypothetical protein